MIIQKFSPRNKCIMVLRDEGAEDKKTEGGLFIPGRAVELANQGEVRAVPPDSQYEVGQRVVFTKYAGSEFTLNGVLYILLPEKDIQGTVDDIEVARIEAGPITHISVPPTDAERAATDKAVQEALEKLAKQAENK